MYHEICQEVGMWQKMQKITETKKVNHQYSTSKSPQNQADKYRNRNKNHWKYRIEIAHNLASKYAFPRLQGKSTKDIVVADLGCSIGTFAIEFAKLGCRTYGVDIDPVALDSGIQLCKEEKVCVEFLRRNILDWTQETFSIDIAVCFDIFEHLYDDELGVLLRSLRDRLSKEGSLIFHTFPTEYDYIFFGKNYQRIPLVPFKNLSTPKFDAIVKSYALLLDIAGIVIKGATFKDRRKIWRHRNPTTKEKLSDIFIRAGYEIIYMESSQLYPFQKSVQKQFSKQPITHRNLYGVAAPKRWV